MRLLILPLAMLLLFTGTGCDETDPLVPDEDFILSINVYESVGRPMAGMSVARLNDLEGFDVFMAQSADPDAYSYPNPFFGSTTVEFSLPEVSEVRIEVLDWNGGHIRDLMGGRLPAGMHSRVWDQRDDGGEKVINGIYLFSLTITDTLDVHDREHSGIIGCTVFDLADPYRYEMGLTDATGFFSTRDLDLFPSLHGYGPQVARDATGAELWTFSFSDTVTIKVSTPPPAEGGWIYHMSRRVMLADGPNYLEFLFVPDDSAEVFIEGR